MRFDHCFELLPLDAFSPDCTGRMKLYGGGKGSSYTAPAPDPNIGLAATQNVELGKEQLQFAREQYAISNERQKKIDELINEVTKNQIDTQNVNTKNAQEQLDYYKQNFVPIEQRMASDAMSYDSDERKDKAAGEAGVEIENQFKNSQDAAMRSQTRMGVNPNSGRFAGIAAGLNAQKSLAKAGAMTNARNKVQDMGIMLRKDAANFGRGMQGTAAQSYGSALSAGNSAVSNGLSGQQSFNQNAGLMNQGFNSALSSNQSAASILNQQYQNQLSAYNAQQQSSAQSAAGLGNFAGMLGSAYLMKSSREVKEDKTPITGALDAIDQLPVEQWKYKEGVEDEGEHIGTYAEDFKEVTGKGDGQSIPVIDAIGLTMKAIQELNEKVENFAGGIPAKKSSSKKGLSLGLKKQSSKNRQSKRG